MFKPIQRICLLVLITVMAGCAARVAPDTPDDIKATRLDDKTGILVGSFTRLQNRQEHVSHTVYFQQEGQSREYQIMSFHGNDVLGLYPKDDFEDDKRKGVLFAFVLPAGAYHFVSYSLESGEGHWQPTRPFSVPFKVEAGKVNYVGDIQLSVREGEGLFGMRAAKGGTFHFINSKDKDIPLLQNKYPDIPWDNVMVTVPDSSREYPQQAVASD